MLIMCTCACACVSACVLVRVCVHTSSTSTHTHTPSLSKGPSNIFFLQPAIYLLSNPFPPPDYTKYTRLQLYYYFHKVAAMHDALFSVNSCTPRGKNVSQAPTGLWSVLWALGECCRVLEIFATLTSMKYVNPRLLFCGENK